MSTDIVDDLHAAEDHIGCLDTAVKRYFEVQAEEEENPDDWDTRAEYMDWLTRMADAESTLRALVGTYERPSCDEDCDDDCCGSPRHSDQTFNDTTGQWEDDVWDFVNPPATDECPAGGEHRAVPDSDENDDMRTFSSRSFHCEECSLPLPRSERDDY